MQTAQSSLGHLLSSPLKVCSRCASEPSRAEGTGCHAATNFHPCHFQKGAKIEDPQKRLDMLLSDFEMLHWKSPNSVNFDSVAQFIQIVENSIRSGSRALTAIQLSFAGEDDPNLFSICKPQRRVPEKINLSSKAELMRSRLNACSKGLLELEGESDQTLPTPQWTICTAL